MVVGLALSLKASTMLSMTSAACSSMSLGSDSDVFFFRWDMLFYVLVEQDYRPRYSSTRNLVVDL